jgi:hypothetical protein
MNRGRAAMAERVIAPACRPKSSVTLLAMTDRER